MRQVRTVAAVSTAPLLAWLSRYTNQAPDAPELRAAAVTTIDSLTRRVSGPAGPRNVRSCVRKMRAGDMVPRIGPGSR